MAILSSIFIMVAVVCGCVIKENRKEKKPLGSAVMALIIFGFLGVVLFVSAVSNGSSSSNSRWSSLSKEEKEWYSRNYGNGKSDAIRNAIDSYSGY